MEPEFSNGTQFPSNSVPDSILTIPVVPAELITEILLRLPVKPLLKFRTRKRPTMYFFLDVGEEKCNYKECPLKSLFHDSVTEALEIDFPIENDIHGLYAMGSCNGLIYLARYCVGYSLLWIPTTRKYKDLPLFRPRSEKHKCAAYGFGYDALHDDYKIVLISYNDIIRSSDDVVVKVYSLKSDSGTSVDYCDETFYRKKCAGYYEYILNCGGSFVDGKLHWDTYIYDSEFDPVEFSGRNIISFDLANEKWEKVGKPSYGEGEIEMCVGTLGSDLCVFTDYKTTHLAAWVMKEYGNKEPWIKMFTITHPTKPNWYPTFFVSIKGEKLMVLIWSNFHDIQFQR
ncbi:hypothetical protein H5410_043937 [Solanum commersonii]|uniref:F-box associated beta-propeller type 1 domain-containing protein n=1 Tax=Solanum commersonii TaxID=4109 RepID=A0A9J5Y0Q5_SOLCO|nr:hypothetical protein H5410_043937 [Solanum commersonii]